jgi:DUF3054 family protein
MAVDNEQQRMRYALLADAVCVIVFCVIGRSSHAEGLAASGIAVTTWPFLTGLFVGWVLSRGYRKPFAIVPTGLAVWVCTVVVGMLLRKATSAGVQTSFVVVASIVTGALLLGWRGALALIRR